MTALVRIHLSLALFALAVGAPAAELADSLHLKVRMRDGVRLCTNAFRPAPRGRFPVLLLRSAYRKSDRVTPYLRPFLDRGYVVVVQDVRGRYHSEGVFQPFIQEQDDGEDTLTWIARQPWSNGRIGMFGGSYSGITQWRAALSAHPALKAIAPAVSGGDEYLDRYYSRGGAFKFGQRLLWIAENFKPPSWPRPEFEKILRHLPLRTADRAFTARTLDFYQQALDHPSYDEYWAALSTRRQAERVQAAALILAGWYDNFAEGDLDMFAALRDLGRPARLIIGPWGHNLSADMPEADFGPAAASPVRPDQLEWFDAHLKQKGASPPGVRYFVTGINEWREEHDWPPRTRATPLYLDSRKGANSLNGDGALRARAPVSSRADGFEYDPRHPVPTLGGAACCDLRVLRWGPLDQRPIEQRNDVLVYTGDPLKNDLEVAGAVNLVLHVASSAPDTDFTAKLVDVALDGRARLLCDGILRLRYRLGVDHPIPYRPGERERIVIPAGVASHVFRAGHRIRVDISSSNFPRFDRNPNTGRPIAEETRFLTARQTVYHDRDHPSRVVLPVRVAAPGSRPLR